MPDRKEIKLPEGLEVDAGLLEQLEALEPAADKNPWTPEKDALLLQYWPVKNHAGVAKLLGVCSTTAIRRYRELTAGTGRETT